MEKYVQFSGHAFPLFRPILFLLILILFPSCVEKKMTLNEAKQVSISMSDKPMVPPPRRINDILELLDGLGGFNSDEIDALKEKARDRPPETDDSIALAKFYWERGVVARDLGFFQQHLTDLQGAVHHAESEEGRPQAGLEPLVYAGILAERGNAEFLCGNFQQAILFEKKALEVLPRIYAYHLLSKFYIYVGDYRSAEKVIQEGIDHCDQYLANPRVRENITIWLKYFKFDLRAMLLEAKGFFKEAELHRRSSLRLILESPLRNRKMPYLYIRRNLTLNLRDQRRLVDAEYEARETLSESIRLCGKSSGRAVDSLLLLGDILLRQGRLKEAEKIIGMGLHGYKVMGIPDNSLVMSGARKLLALVSTARQNYPEAMIQFTNIFEHLKENQYFLEKRKSMNPDFLICLLKTGRANEALKYIEVGYKRYHDFLGDENYYTAEFLALRGMANGIMGKDKEALDDFSSSIPILFKEKPTDMDYLQKQRFLIMHEAYIELLTGMLKNPKGRSFNTDISAEIFKLFQHISGSKVQSSIGSSGARAAAIDPELSDLVRRYQDLTRQQEALQSALSNSLDISPDQRNADEMKELKGTIVTLKKARTVLFDEISRRFPKYTNFTEPKPVTFSEVRKSLLAEEALIAIYPSGANTYIWAIPKYGDIEFAVAPVGKGLLKDMVQTLRKALDPNPMSFGDIPDFDLGLAYGLYSKIMKPVENGWKSAKDLIIVTSTPLSLLNFSLLPTSSSQREEEEGVLFSRYRRVPWLIRKVSLTNLPTISSLISLRSIPEGGPKRRAFAGFGDPIFNTDQYKRVETRSDQAKQKAFEDENLVHVRGIRLSGAGHLDNWEINSLTLEDLNRLPDTAEEIRSIAQTLEADLTKDIFLGKQASEARVKAMDLSDRRVIAFASHGLLPGDLDGLDQPALALSAPMVTGDKEDGLLKMEEILKLKLNADWVVLSACNTGAADGAGAEAFSGLGRAFFYAGTRAILASMWPVETTSAKKLTIGLFHFQKKDPSMTRAKALQKSMLDLIDKQVLKDESTGKVVASYAHPFFWAPFIVVGDGG
ncbi:MAG: CHAT domain-containing protein [Pseudomonadota bacterium]